MLGPALDGREHPQALVVAGLDDLEGAGGQRAGLVEHDRVDAATRLEHLGSAQEDPQLRAASRAHEHGGRSREPQRARAGDDQNRHGRRDRGREVGSGEQPAGEGREGQHHHDGHEDGRDAVGEALHPGLARLGVRDQAAHPGEGRLGADPVDADDQHAVRVEDSARYGRARPDLDRHALSGQHARVDGAGAFEHGAVGGHGLAGSHAEAVADGQRARGHPLLRALRRDPDSVLRPEPEQRPQRSTRVALRARLDVPTREHQHRYRCGDLEVDLVVARATAEQFERHLHPWSAGVAEEQRVHRTEERGADAEADQGVHAHRAVAQRPPRGAVER
ncbi:hypothetical protein ACH61_03210 [Rathayibacter tanaceti]|uniref:Uncharacterized protein n=1 Tax=Rathayibacter tanaceti TaxID=1671680 RepID=A0A166H032_9MICO|nr:hypothetical protein ACH61_03210 [Rathayibacter tanaceti]